jgi:hypothetical protein
LKTCNLLIFRKRTICRILHKHGFEVRNRNTGLKGMIVDGYCDNSLAVDAVCCEPVSAQEFPANREKYREFIDFVPQVWCIHSAICHIQWG